MRTLCLWVLVFCCQVLQAQSIFKVHPYTLLKPNRDMELRFQLNEHRQMNVKVLVNGTIHRDVSENFDKHTLHSLTIDNIPCGSDVSLNLMENDKSLFGLTTPGLPCEGESESFLFMADTQKSEYGTHKKLVDSILKNNMNGASFLLHGGDFVTTGGSNSQWFDYFKDGKKLGHLPQIAVVGNHEYYGDNKTNNMPNNFQYFFRWEEEEKSKGILVYEFNNYHLIVLNTNFDRLSKKDDQKQQRFLDTALWNAFMDQKRVVIAFHHPPFTSAFQGGKSFISHMKKQYVPIFERYQNVALVLSGHQHIYERSFKEGVHYIVTGPSGGVRNLPLHYNSYGKKMVPFTATYISVNVTSERFLVKAYNMSGKVIDSITI